MQQRLSFAIAVCLFGAAVTSRASAADRIATEPASLTRWIDAWRSPSYADRAAATRHLEDAGIDAFPTLVTAAQSTDAEVRHRALTMLKMALEQSAPATTAAARGALTQLGKDTGTPWGRLAAQILHNHDHPAPQPRIDPRILAAMRQRNLQLGMRQAQMPGMPGMPNAIPAIRPNFGMPVIPNPAAANRVTARWFQGSLFLEVDTPTRKVRLEERPGGAIQGEVTEIGPGGNKTERIEAANLAELARKHPSAHETYQKYRHLLDRLRPGK